MDPAATLPPETVYLPFEAGPYRMVMGLTTVAEKDWFEFDALYPQELAERRRLLTDEHAAVFACRPEAEDAAWETLRVMAASLAGHRPAWFGLDGDRLTNRLTGEAWNLAQPGLHPLEVAGRLVQEDVCLIQVQDGVPVFTAAALCFPSRWRLSEKIGKPLADVHGAVPVYPERLAAPVDRFMRHLRDGHIASRLNWAVVDDPTLFQPTGKWKAGENAAITDENAGHRLYLRVERQTLRRLPASGAVVFGIRVHSYRMETVIRSPEVAGRLASAVRALPESIAHYKSLLPVRAALLGWLDPLAAVQSPMH